MTFRESMARIIARECSGDEATWPTKLRVVDMLLDEIYEPAPIINEANRCVMLHFLSGHMAAITEEQAQALHYAGVVLDTAWMSMIAAIKSEA